MNKVAAILLSLILAMAVGIGCSQVKSSLGLAPEPFVQHSSVETAVIGGDYAIVVSALIFNAQADHHGNVEVTVDIWTQGRHWKKSKVIYLDASEIVEIVFKEPTFISSGILGGDINHRVKVEPCQ